MESLTIKRSEEAGSHQTEARLARQRESPVMSRSKVAASLCWSLLPPSSSCAIFSAARPGNPVP